MKLTTKNCAPPAVIKPQIIALSLRHAPLFSHSLFISSTPPTPVMDQLEGALRRTDAAMARGGNHALNHGGGPTGPFSLQAPSADQITGPARCPAGSAPTAVVHPARHGAQREVATGSVRSLSPSSPPDCLPIETAAQTLPRIHLGARSSLSTIQNRKSQFPSHELPPPPSRQ
jgi:hypothetical protein